MAVIAIGFFLTTRVLPPARRAWHCVHCNHCNHRAELRLRAYGFDFNGHPLDRDAVRKDLKID